MAIYVKNQDKELEFSLSLNLYDHLQLYKVDVQKYHQKIGWRSLIWLWFRLAKKIEGSAAKVCFLNSFLHVQRNKILLQWKAIQETSSSKTQSHVTQPEQAKSNHSTFRTQNHLVNCPTMTSRKLDSSHREMLSNTYWWS